MPALRVPAELPATNSIPSFEYLQRRNHVLHRRAHGDGLKDNLIPICLAFGGFGIVICLALVPAYLKGRRERKKMVPV
ncbi:hypothetical protein FVEN_g12927 [Fusarium venenatum]|uniref:Uncharacterized protein n=1 Tax=Fusarium venenatum TaxID=56646 RepID=A0A2L2T9H1_9HYPO|nr:uncharacterized protein FVRRES_03011 [Fusarium venenatum]KAG8353770.1 hypothetical protein FVEN_g12927 [Fusarium venenatum]CEI66499.1 unnamed protein product [Fusarium venenatum]